MGKRAGYATEKAGMEWEFAVLILEERENGMTSDRTNYQGSDYSLCLCIPELELLRIWRHLFHIRN